jgi:hypothetical protein
MSFAFLGSALRAFADRFRSRSHSQHKELPIMAIVDFTTTSSAPARRSQPFGGQTHPNEDKPKAKVWMNVGYEMNGRFIHVPGSGTPIDTTEALPVRGQNEDYIKQVTAQNGTLKLLQDIGAKLQPGQEQVLNLQVRIRRVNEELVVAREDNEYAIDMSRLLVAAE